MAFKKIKFASDLIFSSKINRTDIFTSEKSIFFIVKGCLFEKLEMHTFSNFKEFYFKKNKFPSKFEKRNRVILEPV
jgi:hypothetical protein